MNRAEYIEKAKVKDTPKELKGIKFTERYEGENGGYLDIIHLNGSPAKFCVSIFPIEILF